FYEEIRPDLERHSLEYPFLGLRIPFLTYESTGGRSSYQRFQSGLRRIPGLGKRYSPRPIDNPIVPIILPGVDYSAESLVTSSSLQGEKLPAKGMLGWQHLDAYADYCVDVLALGRETYASLLTACYCGYH